MLVTSANFKIKNDALEKQPVYVAQIFWNQGNAGTPGVNDIYFATCDVNDITGFAYSSRWFPFLKSDSIGSLSQTVDPINGVSSIGSIDLTITDYQNKVSDIIKAADAAGHGLRRQRIAIYRLFKGMDWADRLCVRTMQINDLRLSSLNEYKLSAADVQRQMQKTVFNPYSTTLTAAITTTGAITPTVLDSRNFFSATSVVYGTCGFIKIDDEIMRWTANANNTFTIGASDRGMFGTVAATHANNAKVAEIIVLNENPITMMLKIMESSGIAAVNGTYDVLPARWGCNMNIANSLDEAGILQVGKLLAGLGSTPAANQGIQFEFVLEKGVEAKKFIEDSILKILGAFGFVRGDGKYSIKAYADLANAAKENASVTLNQNAVIKWGDLTYNYTDLANQVWIDFDEYPKLSGKYLRTSLFIDSVSIKKWGEAKQLKYTADGVVATSAFASQLYQVFQRVLSRYSRPPMQITLTLLPKFNLIEIGDIVRVTLPIRDLFTGESLDRAFEVISVQLKVATGEIEVKCIAQPERAAFWFQGVGTVQTVTISPGAVNLQTGTTLQMVARAFDTSGKQIPIPAISWVATGNVTVSLSGLITAGATGAGAVYAVVGDKVSNTVNITVTATANANAVASVSVMPSSVLLKAADTQQMVAVAYDVAGNMVDGKTFNWNSSNTGVATIPAGAGTSKLLTAVANGSSNITATETGTSIASPASPVTVATPDTPTYAPSAIADAAYQIGTKITAHGPVGGPHVIPDGYNFAAGDYWYDGSVSLANGTTCTINGTVRIFSLGSITINGTVDGVGRGVAGAAGTDTSTPFSNYGGVYTYGGLGNAGTIQGFVGNGGSGNTYKLGATPLFQSTPAINVVATSIAGGVWQAVSGLPDVLYGSQASSGGCQLLSNSSAWPTTWTGILSGAGGGSGAGLLLMARGIYIVAGSVNLNGVNGGDADLHFQSATGGATSCSSSSGGGGGGGSLVCLAERDVNGLPVMSVLTTRINTNGGNVGTSYSSTGSYPSWQVPSAGGNGCVITQIIG